MSTPSPYGSNGRDAAGRFAKGNGGGPGNPHGRQVAELRRTVLGAVTPDEVAELVRVIWDKARAGDMGAAKLLLSYLIGQPVAGVEVMAHVAPTVSYEEAVRRARALYGLDAGEPS